MTNGYSYATRSLTVDPAASSALLAGWRRRALTFGAVFTILAVVLVVLSELMEHDGFLHLLTSWLMGSMLCWGFSLGGLALLMVQYCSGGKWGLLVRRPLEAMSRTLWITALMFLPILIFMKRIYLWARYSNPSEVAQALSRGLIDKGQAHALNWKHPMLSPVSVWVQILVCFAIWFTYVFFINRWSLERDADPNPNVPFWQKRFENISGFGIVVYALTLTALVIDLVMSANITWFSTMYGLNYLVAQGYAVLALSVITVVSLSKAEPMKTVLRVVEQHDLGKLMFAFVMLNIYLNFSQFLIIWSGNSPEEISWYLDRIRGHWGIIFTFDFIFHWLIPFCLLLSRDIKRNKRRIVMVGMWMIFARCWDMFLLIEPNFSPRHLHFSIGILEYIAVPGAMISFWVVAYINQLGKRPLVQTNDPHLAEILEAEHAHA
ncbi:MAG TPA: hypothetical protein VH139_12590 [Acidobacteriaceae bacterium]|nr:hypothetical protein [Acidobacteriaceae bacterium]